MNVLYDVIDDNIAEPNETMMISISKVVVIGIDVGVSYNISSVNVTIIDNDSEDMFYDIYSRGLLALP